MGLRVTPQEPSILASYQVLVGTGQIQFQWKELERILSMRYLLLGLVLIQSKIVIFQVLISKFYLAFDFLTVRSLRKGSEVVKGSTDTNIFCLRSEDDTTVASFNLNQFISPLK